MLSVVATSRSYNTNHQILLLFSLFLLRHPFIHLCKPCCLLLCVLIPSINRLIINLFLLFCVWKLLPMSECLCVLFLNCLCIENFKKLYCKWRSNNNLRKQKHKPTIDHLSIFTSTLLSWFQIQIQLVQFDISNCHFNYKDDIHR